MLMELNWQLSLATEQFGLLTILEQIGLSELGRVLPLPVKFSQREIDHGKGLHLVLMDRNLLPLFITEVCGLRLTQV
jgi:hypothetical protein